VAKFSIITVCLNAEHTIRRCLESVLSQSYIDYEHIIIDGVSSDRTLDIVKEYNNVKWISEPDTGIYDAMNKGIQMSNGEYIVFLNSDDEFLPDFLDRTNSKGDVDYISNAINMIGESQVRVWNPRLPNDINFFFSMPIPHAGLVVRRLVFEQMGLFDLHFRIAADFDFVIRLLKAGYKGAANDKPVLNFYMGGVSNNFKIVKENNLVREKHFDQEFNLKKAYFLDLLRYLKNNVLKLS